ncbi:MAG: zinc ribbon domain-containing protein [Thermoplasmata archaeon]
MPACLHCGRLAPEGALFCPTCGWTVPQVEPYRPITSVGVAPPPPPNYPGPAWIAPPPPPPPPPAPMPTSGVRCPRCNTVISQFAVYCPVCQERQLR